MAAVGILRALGDDPLAVHPRLEDVAVAAVAQGLGVGREVDRGWCRVPPAELVPVAVLVPVLVPMLVLVLVLVVLLKVVWRRTSRSSYGLRVGGVGKGC